MSTVTATPLTLLATDLDPRVERSKPDLRRFAMLVIPLALLLFTFKVYNLEQPAFFRLACIVFGGFAISYWLPFRYKEPFLILLSLAGAYVLLSPLVASLLIAVGLLLFGIVRSGLEFRWRVLALVAILCRLHLRPRQRPVPRSGRLLAGAGRHVHVPHDHLPLRREAPARPALA